MQIDREAIRRSMELVDLIAAKRRDPDRCQVMVARGRRRVRQCRFPRQEGADFCVRHAYRGEASVIQE